MDDFHFVNNGQIQTFEDEYPYHKKVLNLKYFLDQGIKNVGGIIVSLPYYANGGQPENYKDIMLQCEFLGIPVMIDCAHFGTGAGLKSSLFDYDCIKAVAFSLSKPLATGRWRIGTVFTDIDFPHISVLNDSFYTPMLAARIGMNLMDNFSPDYIYETYKPLQDIICEQNDLFPSPVVMTAHNSDGRRWGIAKGLMRLIKKGESDE